MAYTYNNNITLKIILCYYYYLLFSDVLEKRYYDLTNFITAIVARSLKHMLHRYYLNYSY